MRGTLRRLLRQFAVEEKAGVLALIAVSLVPLLGATGLAIDTGRAMIARLQLSRAVDAATLAGARALRQGQVLAEQEAYAVAAANGIAPGFQGISMSIAFGTTPDGEQTLTMSAQRTIPTLFMRLFGRNGVLVRSNAQTSVPPLDLVLVLDRSGSLTQQGAWVPLQQAAGSFVQFFDDNLDKMGLVSFQIRANHDFFLNHFFRVPVTQQINTMNSVGDTNTGEGLRLALDQLQSGAARAAASKVVVFFTDGRPTAFRGNINGSDRVLAVFVTGNDVRGYFNNPNSLPMSSSANPTGCDGVNNCTPPPGPTTYNESLIRNLSRQYGLTIANQIRSDGIYIYTIALGNPSAGNPLLTPDLGYLRQIANENGVVDPNQPQGKLYVASTPGALQAVFQAVAQDLLVRLSI